MSSQFALENEITSITRMDAPINKGPMARWQRKALEANSNSALNASTGGGNRLNASTSNKLNSSSSRFGNLSLVGANSSLVGTKRPNEGTRKTPSKTPKKSPGRNGSNTTPGRKTPGGGPDRFIASRSGTDFEASGFRLMHHELSDAEKETMSPSKREYQRMMAENLNGGELDKTRIIAYQHKPPSAPEDHSNGLKVLYSNAKAPGSVKKSVRHIPQVPERILDAPDIANDYYLNLIDWSCNNHLAVALGAHVYLWNASNGEIQQLLELESPEDYVCSVRWIKEGNFLAVGNSLGEIGLWDVEKMKRLRLMTGHTERVSSMSWNQYILTSGSRSGSIHHSDVRVANHLVASISNGHSQEVCGLAWSPDGKFLASGGNDNVLNIWSAVQGECFTESTPKYSFTQHQAAVKAVSWCPWQPHILASGGGTADRCIRLWNCNNGTLVNTIDTKSQVCSLVWSSEYKELASSHGFANNEITIWKYPTMTKTAELLGHTERVLHLALSPDGSTLVSAGADETLRLWKCFIPDPTKKKQVAKGKEHTSSALRPRIR